MKTWTTEEHDWLTERFPHWLKRGEKKEKGFVKRTTVDFLVAFPTRQNIRLKMPNKIRQWFHYFARKQSQPTKPAAPSILSIRHRQKVVPLTRVQVYSRLFCKKGSPLQKEIQAAWELYVRGDEATLNEYHHLFSPIHNPDLPFVAFQQAVLRDKVAAAMEEELSVIDEYINTHYEEKKDQDKRPWNALKVDEGQSEVDLERQYITKQVEGLSVSLTAVCNEVKDATNFKPFIIYGGPAPNGSGTMQIFHSGSGETSSRGQTFEEYIGHELWDRVKAEYTNWLNQTYSDEEILRLEGSVNGPSKTNPAISSNPAPSNPAPSNPASTPQQSPGPEMTPRGTSEVRAVAPIRVPPIATLTPAPPTEESDSLDKPDASSPTPTRGTTPMETTPDEPEVPSRRAPFAHAWIPAYTPSWSLGPQHGNYVHAAAPYLIAVPGGPQWEKLLASYVMYESLAASQRSLTKQSSCKLPPRPRPHEIAWWFKHGRRQLGAPKDLPLIESIETFEETWVEWWRAIQPGWQNTESWPFKQELEQNPDDGDLWWGMWGTLLNGGKDSLFIVVLSLGWWIEARDPSKESKVDDAVKDVTWLIDSLVTFLGAYTLKCYSGSDDNPSTDVDSDSDDDPDDDTNSASHATRPPMLLKKQSQKKQPQRKPVQRNQPQKRRAVPLKIGPPAKRAHARS